MPESSVAVYMLRPPTPLVSSLMYVCLWSGELGFESLSRNQRPSADRGPRALDARWPVTDTEPILSAVGPEKPCIRTASERALDRGIGAALLVTIVALIVGLLVYPRPAEASSPWRSTTATWYGPGFYGGTTACGQRYTTRTRGVAHMTMRCGQRLTICRRGRCVRVKVIDRGAFDPDHFDLSARTAQDLCRCWRPYTMTVRWRKGWAR